jgi:hypothetical protein
LSNEFKSKISLCFFNHHRSRQNYTVVNKSSTSSPKLFHAKKVNRGSQINANVMKSNHKPRNAKQFQLFFTSESSSSELKITSAHLTVKLCKIIQLMMVGYGPLNVHFNLYEPYVLYIGQAYRYPPDVAFYIYFFNKYKY